MGRQRLTTEQISDKIEDIKETLDYLKEKRANSNSDEEKNVYTKKIGMAKKNLNSFINGYQDRLPRQIKKEEPKQQLIPSSRPTLKAKLQQLREKAEELLSKATTDEERKSIKERLYYAELHYKYSY